MCRECPQRGKQGRREALSAGDKEAGKASRDADARALAPSLAPRGSSCPPPTASPRREDTQAPVERRRVCPAPWKPADLSLKLGLSWEPGLGCVLGQRVEQCFPSPSQAQTSSAWIPLALRARGVSRPSLAVTLSRYRPAPRRNT